MVKNTLELLTEDARGFMRKADDLFLSVLSGVFTEERRHQAREERVEVVLKKNYM